MRKICLNCKYERKETETVSVFECPSCRTIYAKVEAEALRKAAREKKIRLAEEEKGRLKTEQKAKIAEELIKKDQLKEENRRNKEIRNSECVNIAIETGLTASQALGLTYLEHLQEILIQDERLLALSMGLIGAGTCTIALTDKRILIVGKGFFGGTLQSCIDLDRINTISGSTGLLTGEIFIQDGENRIINSVIKASVVVFVDKARGAIEMRKKQQQETTQHTNLNSIEKLEKLALLKERGVISDAEFEQEKKKILGYLY